MRYWAEKEGERSAVVRDFSKKKHSLLIDRLNPFTAYVIQVTALMIRQEIKGQVKVSTKEGGNIFIPSILRTIKDHSIITFGWSHFKIFFADMSTVRTNLFITLHNTTRKYRSIAFIRVVRISSTYSKDRINSHSIINSTTERNCLIAAI